MKAEASLKRLSPNTLQDNLEATLALLGLSNLPFSDKPRVVLFLGLIRLLMAERGNVLTVDVVKLSRAAYGFTVPFSAYEKGVIYYYLDKLMLNYGVAKILRGKRKIRAYILDARKLKSKPIEALARELIELMRQGEEA